MRNLFKQSFPRHRFLLTALLALGCGAPALAQDIVPDSVRTLPDSAATVENMAIAEGNAAAEAQAAKEERQEKVWKKRKKYAQFSYLIQTTKVGSPTAYDMKSSGAFGVTMGRTYYLHKKPLGGMVKFGIDFSYFNLRYAGYDKGLEPVAGSSGDFSFDGPTIASHTRASAYDDYIDDAYDELDIDLGTHQLNVGMQVGPSVTVNPIHELKVAAYFRYSPTFDMFIANEEFGCGYGSYFNYGLSVSWKVISLGVELYNGTSKYEHNGFANASDKNGKVKFKTSGTNLYVALRF